MIKKVLCEAGININIDTALATLGWLSFFGSFLMEMGNHQMKRTQGNR